MPSYDIFLKHGFRGILYESIGCGSWKVPYHNEETTILSGMNVLGIWISQFPWNALGTTPLTPLHNHSTRVYINMYKFYRCLGAKITICVNLSNFSKFLFIYALL
jgi:hypothetical protein